VPPSWSRSALAGLGSWRAGLEGKQFRLARPDVMLRVYDLLTATKSEASTKTDQAIESEHSLTMMKHIKSSASKGPKDEKKSAAHGLQTVSGREKMVHTVTSTAIPYQSRQRNRASKEISSASKMAK
jgi:hypothetical protein